jgi:hypothetical protein
MIIRHFDFRCFVVAEPENNPELVIDLFAFITTEDRTDEHLRDIISIELVRIAQKGNISAKREIMRLLRFTIDDWIERNPKLSCWMGYDELIQTRLECCIRCYRYSGSFMRYLFKTLEYAGRGLRPIIAYSLDDCAHRKERPVNHRAGIFISYQPGMKKMPSQVAGSGSFP